MLILFAFLYLLYIITTYNKNTTMKKNLLSLCLMVLGVSAIAQTPRLSLYEEFTGETCPPCASTNPGLDAKLSASTNTPLMVAIKWQVPIPSAPTLTWSLYQTNKTEIDWRWKSGSGNYGYSPAISSAPSSKIDGQEATVFGAAGGHPNYLNNGVIATAQSYTSAFSVTLNRAWNANGTAITATVNIQATANFTAVGPLVFRLVMIEEEVNFATQPGTNGEKHFYHPVIKSFPNIQTGTSMASTWTIGQTQTFTINCPLPSYVRSKAEVALVGFIQDDGNQKVAQAVRASKAPLTNDAMAIAALVNVTCNSAISPNVTVKNNGASAITALTITPYTDAAAGTPVNWTGNLAVGASTTIALGTMSTPTVSGSHTFSYNITAMNGLDFDLTNNAAKVNYVVAANYQGAPVVEGFTAASYPPVGWAVINPDAGPSWTRNTVTGGYNLTQQCTKYDFFNNPVVGDVDELFIPPIDLSGSAIPQLYFDLAYAQRDLTSNDKLEVMVSNNCGSTWTTVYSSSGAVLPATAPPVPYEYVPDPNDPSQWKTEQIGLTGFNTSNVLVKFVATNGNGNCLYLDNVNLAQTAPTGINTIKSSQWSVNVFPNPSNGISTVAINAVKSGSAKLTVLNTLGQVVNSKVVNLTEGSNNIMLDLSGNANGVYSIMIDSNNGSQVKKITLSK